MSRAARRAIVLALGLAVLSGCGKKGPPLVPLRPVPEAPGTLAAARLGADVHLRFTVPARNVSVPGPVDIDRIEIYAASLAPGAPAPPNHEFLTEKYLVGTVIVRPAPVPGVVEPEGAEADGRPVPGAAATFVEPLTVDMLNPPVPEAVAAPPPAAAATPAAPAYPTRIYAARGITRGGRPGAPTARITVPLVDPPPAPAGLEVSFTESAFVLTWLPVVGEVGGVTPGFAVYRAESPAAPLTTEPVTEPRAEIAGVDFGVERCFSVRSTAQVGGVPIESDASAPVCVTPRDIFAPAAPAGLTGVASSGVIALIWDANTEADLAGYLVLRADGPGETLRPLTPSPIRETAYRDTSVTPGVRYEYAIVAVDRATPPNSSAPSARYGVTAAQ